MLMKLIIMYINKNSDRISWEYSYISLMSLEVSAPLFLILIPESKSGSFYKGNPICESFDTWPETNPRDPLTYFERA